MTWYHPNYYRKLRAERKKIPVSGTKERETAPSGIKTEDLIVYKKFHKLMVTSLKDPSVKRTTSGCILNQNLVQVLKHQATSGKATSTSVKRQAASSKLPDS